MKYWILVLFVSCCFSSQASDKIRITSGADPYVIDLLNHILNSQEARFSLELVNNIPTQDRAIRLLGDKNGIDLLWSVTSYEREKQAMAIRIPIVKGVLGYRLGVIKQSNVGSISALQNNGQLRALRYGLRGDWPDSAIFKSNGFNVLEYSKERTGYELLTADRIDILPIDALFVDKVKTMAGLTIDPAHVFYYPSAVYFFVHKDNVKLHDLLKNGLLNAIEDGSFNALFNQHFQEKLTKLELEKRQKITLYNTLLPASAPIYTKKYWHHQNQGK